MTNRNTILNELNDIGSTLGNLSPQNLFAVPYGYFEGLPTQIMNRIKALEAANAKEELEYLSPMLSKVSKEMPYSVPVGFFQNFGDSVMQKISEHVNHLQNESPKESFVTFGQTSKEEIENLSPLLSSLKNRNPYSVPAGYFETLETRPEKKEGKVISITSRKWYRMAVAAAVIGIVAITGLLMINRGKTIFDKDPQTWANKVIKEVGEEKVNEFVTLVSPEESQKPAEENESATQAEVKELMKDVSQKEIDEFLDDAIAFESNDDTDALMN